MQTKKRFFYELYLILIIALPMMIAQVAQVGTGFVDTLMAGHVSRGDLAAVGFGSSVFATIYITLLGFPTALNPLLSHAFGAKRFDELRHTTQQGVWLCLLVGLLGALLVALTAIILPNFLNWDEKTVRTTQLYLYGIALGMPASIVGRALQSFAAAVGRTQEMMWIGILGLLLNIPLNYVLIYGVWGLPKLGGAGCGFASAVVFYFNMIGLWLCLSYHTYFKKFALNQAFRLPEYQAFKPILQLGTPICFSFFIEVSLFTFISLLIARSGEEFVAVQQVVMTISGVLYMLPQSLGAAVAARIGQSLGAKQRQRAAFIAQVCIIAGAVGALLVGVLLGVFRLPVLQLFSTDETVLKLGRDILLLAAAYQVVDAVQTIAAGALRGYKATKVPMMIHFTAFWLLGLGLGAYLCFGIGLGLHGFWYALVVALTAAAVLLTAYLYYLARYMIHSR
ncbi:MAG: MATE family efflux transporter [Neisseriaceae bacterium]|nr:MATE family efflux transporter [Neisseriaceae bacterium]